MITTNGQHRISVEVELEDGTVIRRVVKFSGGNPLFHAKETANAADKATNSVLDALAGMYGDIRTRQP